MRTQFIPVTTGALAAGLVFAAAPAGAQDDTIDLGEIVVSAGLTAAPSAAVGSAHTIVTGEELEELQIRYVADALRHVPGVAVTETGSTGGLTQVRLRGAEANHVLVMIDGVEASEVSQGEYDFGNLLAADIERIEVLRGPQSAFWGSNATAGVINIVTRSGRRGGVDARVATEVGTDGTAMVSPFIGGGGDTYDFALSGAFRRNDGFNISDFGDEDDGHRNATVNGKGQIDLAHNLFLTGNFRFVDRRADADAQDFSGGALQGLVLDTNDWTDTRDLLGGAGLKWELLEGRFVQEARVEALSTERDSFSFGALSYANEGSRLAGTYQASLDFDTPDLLGAHHRVTAGVEAQRETYRNLPPAPATQQLRQERDQTSFVGQYRVDFLDTLFLSGAVRHDENDAFADATTYSASAAYLMMTDTRLHASVGTGITNPTFFEQFGFDPTSFLGNPNLKPEESFGWDVGIEQTLFDGRLVADVTYFNARLEDEITVVFGPGVLTPINLDGESPREGVEVSLTARPVEGLSVTGSYTYVDAEEPSGLPEVLRPAHSGSLTATYSFLEGRAKVFADAVFNGEAEDNEFVTFGRTTLEPYTVIDIGGEYAVNDRFTVFGRVDNLFDEEYEQVFGYNTKGITGYAGVRVTLGGDPI